MQGIAEGHWSLNGTLSQCPFSWRVRQFRFIFCQGQQRIARTGFMEHLLLGKQRYQI
jgi:hypothetical protein